MAKFPTALAADQDLLVAVDNSYGTLSTAIGTADTTLAINYSAGTPIGLYAVVSVNNEQMLVTAINTGSTVLTVQRHFNGTAAAAANIGTLVSVNFSSAYHNGLKNEVEAIETALGGNLANVAALPFTDVTTGNVSTTAHGLVPKLPNDSTKYLNGVGAWAAGGSTSQWTTSGANIYFTGGKVGIGGVAGLDPLEITSPSGNFGIKIITTSNLGSDYAALRFVQGGSQAGSVYTNLGRMMISSARVG
jgi:hypothetical protein